MTTPKIRISRTGALTMALGAAGALSLMALCPAGKTEPQKAHAPNELLTGQAALNSDWADDQPGLRRHFTVADLPAAYATQSVDNGAHMVPKPDGALPKAPAGFAVEAFATGLNNPRKIITAPNGDLFIAESGPNRIHVLRDTDGDGKPDSNEVFVDGLKQPFGLAFYPAGPNPKYLYVANTDSVVRFPYHKGDLKATGPGETIIDDISGGGRLRGGGHWTRDIVFSKDGKHLFVSVGSRSNVEENDGLIEVEKRRARIFEYDVDGKNEQVYASGIRNPVGIAINPITAELWMSVNERDGLGDNLVPDYVGHVEPGGFYGWPWYYMGNNPDGRAKGDHPADLGAKTLIPDVLVQPHSASLCVTFYEGKQFPKEYVNDAFAAEHGSWNRARRTGYKVIRVATKKGKATGEYQDFLTGFVTTEGDVWGRPVGVTVGKNGDLFVTDDGSNTVWRVSYKK
ncbi:sorbosone dehydrogenase [Capsulimonas corticalis]|uniref:Sorbosone dehydrogenase n=1 Tax=Capsulimonas corticalis TaxID=2219043 RepID=A0A402CPR4_9BACT|nr:sorbosone dehydrogenase family protein [Capsulimonas corticalis]BDI32918.1 sorbosone dehydrogenase [Capsulimonas corticalis]